MNPKQIISEIKINIELAKVNGKPLLAEVSMDQKSQEYIEKLIREYAQSEYLRGIEDGKIIQLHGTVNYQS